MRNLIRTTLAAAAFAALTTPALAQEEAKPAEAKPAPPWVVECSNRATGDALVCQMVQLLIQKNTGQRVLSATIVKKPDGKTFALTLGLPHGIDIPAGVQVAIDNGDKIQAPIVTADQNGSYATVDLTAKLIAAMQKGSLLNVTVKSRAGGDLVLQLSLTGFGAALDKV